MTRRIPLLSGLLALLTILFICGCAQTPQLHQVSSVYVCADENCGAAGKRYSATQLLKGLHRLLQSNEGLDYKLCESDERSRHCIQEGVGHTVFAMVVPGPGRQHRGSMRQIELDLTGQTIRVRKSDPKTFFGSPVICTEHGGTFTVRSADEISLVDEAYFCNWAGVGNMTVTFTLAIESIDFDKGRITGYWTHAMAGTGSGSGQGYAAIEFPRTMPRGENWLE